MKKSSLVSTIAFAAGLAALALPAGADHRPGGDGYRGDFHRGGGAVLYADAGFRGEGIRIDGAEPNLSRYRFNDRASSIEIRSGVWQVCVDADFRGHCEIIDANAPSLKPYRLNDNISSLRPVRHDARRGGWDRGGWGRGGWGASLVLYPDQYMRGQGIEIDQDVPDLSPYRFNDRASSFQVNGGTWLVCEHANYKGRCEVLEGGAGELKPIRMNDNISSIRRIDRRGY